MSAYFHFDFALNFNIDSIQAFKYKTGAHQTLPWAPFCTNAPRIAEHSL